MSHAREYSEAAQGGDAEACLAAVVTALIHTWTAHPAQAAAGSLR